jgi:hypothetical protein
MTWDRGNYKTISAASRSLKILDMGLISDIAEWCWLLAGHVCQAMPIFGWQLAESSSLNMQILTKSHGICGPETISAASRPMNILHIWV